MHQHHINLPAKQEGWISLVITMLLMTTITSIVLYTAKTEIAEQKVYHNNYQSQLTFEAAEAGLDFGVYYLGENGSTIVVDTNSDGNIDAFSDAQTSNFALSNGARYNIVFSNPIPNNLNLIRVTSTGVSPDGLTSRIINQIVNYKSTLSAPPAFAIAAKDFVELNGNVDVINTELDTTIWAGGDVTLTGSASTTISSGTASNSSALASDVVANDPSLTAPSGESFFQNFFGVSKSQIKDTSDLIFSNSTGTNYSSNLDTQQNKVIWIDQTAGNAVVNSGITIGSPTEPVILIVDGDFQINGDLVFYGVLYVSKGIEVVGGGNAEVHGVMISEQDITLNGNLVIDYDSTLLGNVQKNLGEYTRVAGTWNDLQ